MATPQSDEYRILVLPATRRDAEVIMPLLERTGLTCALCMDTKALAGEVAGPVGAILLTDACFQDEGIEEVLRRLADQPPWSDVPVVLLCHAGPQSATARWVTANMHNLTVLERPASIRTLTSSLQAALRARDRQYQMRAQFNELQVSESALKSASKALADANRRKDEFLAMLAHELRNPLAPIRSASEVLARGITDPQQQRLVSMVQRQVTHLARLVDDLLDVARITEGRIELRRAMVDVAAVAAEAREAVEPLIQEKRHTLRVAGSPGVLLVNGDHARLVQSIANILTNAAKYTDPGGFIELSWEKQDEEVAIVVTDNGIGIAPELLPHLFDLFVQGDRTLGRSQGGLGIGLSVVRRLIQMHGGQVTARSDGPRQGSRFEIRLPLAEMPKQTTPSSERPTAPSRRILVVDDNIDAADSLAMLLEMEGHTIEVAYTGQRALERAEEIRPDVILLDVGLPDINGYEVAERLRPQLPSVQIVAVTGYGQGDDVRRAAIAGFDAHVIKPIDFDRLSEVLARFDPSGKGRGDVVHLSH